MASNDSVSHIVPFIVSVPVCIMYIIVILPLSIFILYLGFKQWKSKKNDPSWFINYTDFFTYNLVIMELVGVAGYFASLCIIFKGDFISGESTSPFFWGNFGWYGEMMFPTCTCIEHYVAVVHPVMFLGLKKGKGRLIRNISTGLVWVLTLTSMTVAVTVDYGLFFFIGDVCQMVVYLGIVFYCSVAVLKVLIHPKPGGAVTDKRKVQKSKRHAFIVIVLVLVVLSLKLCINAILNIIWAMNKINEVNFVAAAYITYMNNLLTSLTLPLLYLQRTGKLQQCVRTFGIRKYTEGCPGFKCKSKSEPGLEMGRNEMSTV